MNACSNLVYLPHPEFIQVCLLNDRAAREQELISLAQGGSLDALNELILSYQDTVFRQAFWMLFEEEAAEDATQEVFILIFRKLYTFRGGSFRAWLLRITTNYCLDQIRSRKRQRYLSLEQSYEDGGEKEPYWKKSPGENPEQVVERLETREMINRSFQKLTPKYRKVILLIDFHELDYREASAVLGLPMGTVKSRLARARQKLKADLQETFKN